METASVFMIYCFGVFLILVAISIFIVAIRTY